MPPLEALPTPVEEVLRRGVQSLISFGSAAESQRPSFRWSSSWRVSEDLARTRDGARRCGAHIGHCGAESRRGVSFL